MSVEIRLLGPLEFRRDGSALRLWADKLLLDPRRALHAYISRRRSLHSG